MLTPPPLPTEFIDDPAVITGTWDYVRELTYRIYEQDFIQGYLNLEPRKRVITSHINWLLHMIEVRVAMLSKEAVKDLDQRSGVLAMELNEPG